MLNKADLVVFYFTYAALMMALMVCSVLSPIQVRSVGERNLFVYGVALAYNPPPSTWLAASDRASKSSIDIMDTSSGSSLPIEGVRIRTSLAHLPASTLTRCMTAYLVFASLCLLTCLSLLVSLFVQMLPLKHGRAAVLITRVLAVLVPLAAIACFAMAAVLGLQSHLYHNVAAGYYTDARRDSPVRKLHSGFFSSVAAAVIGLLVVLLSPVLRMW